MLKGGISDPRNKALMKMFNMIGIGERAGSGVPDIYSVWEDQGWEVPVVEEQYNPDRTILTLSFTKKSIQKTSKKNKQKKQAEKTSRKNKQKKQAEKIISNGKAAKTEENKKRILKFLASEGSSKAADIAEYIGLSPARTRVLIAELVDEGKVRAEGNGRLRRYGLLL